MFHTHQPLLTLSVQTPRFAMSDKLHQAMPCTMQYRIRILPSHICFSCTCTLACSAFCWLLPHCGPVQALLAYNCSRTFIYILRSIFPLATVQWKWMSQPHWPHTVLQRPRARESLFSAPYCHLIFALQWLLCMCTFCSSHRKQTIQPMAAESSSNEQFFSFTLFLAVLKIRMQSIL